MLLIHIFDDSFTLLPGLLMVVWGQKTQQCAGKDEQDEVHNRSGG